MSQVCKFKFKTNLIALARFVLFLAFIFQCLTISEQADGSATELASGPLLSSQPIEGDAPLPTIAGGSGPPSSEPIGATETSQAATKEADNAGLEQHPDTSGATAPSSPNENQETAEPQLAGEPQQQEPSGELPTTVTQETVDQSSSPSGPPEQGGPAESQPESAGDPSPTGQPDESSSNEQPTVNPAEGPQVAPGESSVATQANLAPAGEQTGAGEPAPSSPPDAAGADQEQAKEQWPAAVDGAPKSSSDQSALSEPDPSSSARQNAAPEGMQQQQQQARAPEAQTNATSVQVIEGTQPGGGKAADGKELAELKQGNEVDSEQAKAAGGGDQQTQAAPTAPQVPVAPANYEPPPPSHESTPISNTTQHEHKPNNDIMDKSSFNQTATSTNQTEADPGHYESPETIGEYEILPNFELDPVSCGQIEPTLPGPVLNMTIEKILKTIVGKKCSSSANLKLKPTTNKLLNGFVMQVSSMPIELVQLTLAPFTRVYCVKTSQEPPKVTKLQLAFEQNLDDQWLASRWRLYKSLHQDEIPIELADETSTSSRWAGGSRLTGRQLKGNNVRTDSDKCQRFEARGGNFYLQLLSFKTTLSFEIDLVKLGERSYSTSLQHGGRIQVAGLAVRELYLDQGLKLNGQIGRQKQANGAWASVQQHHQQHQRTTVQILHDRNNHHRKNNWLLDTYANWLKHEYRSQLAHLLAPGGQLIGQLNSCFVNLAD